MERSICERAVPTGPAHRSLQNFSEARDRWFYCEFRDIFKSSKFSLQEAVTKEILREQSIMLS